VRVDEDRQRAQKFKDKRERKAAKRPGAQPAPSVTEAGSTAVVDEAQEDAA
jgi:hypothetical protein